jgi:hypothetical protein
LVQTGSSLLPEQGSPLSFISEDESPPKILALAYAQCRSNKGVTGCWMVKTSWTSKRMGCNDGSANWRLRSGRGRTDRTPSEEVYIHTEGRRQAMAISVQGGGQSAGWVPSLSPGALPTEPRRAVRLMSAYLPLRNMMNSKFDRRRRLPSRLGRGSVFAPTAGLQRARTPRRRSGTAAGAAGRPESGCGGEIC